MSIVDTFNKAVQMATAYMYHSNNCEWEANDRTKCDCGYLQILIQVNKDFDEVLGYLNR